MPAMVSVDTQALFYGGTKLPTISALITQKLDGGGMGGSSNTAPIAPVFIPRSRALTYI